MRHLPAVIARMLEAGVVLTSAVLLAVMLGLVLTRYVLGWSVVGLHELALIAALWLYMLGGIVASRRREHLVVDFVPSRLTDPRARRWHALVVSAISVAILALFTYWAWRLIAWGIQLPQTTPALGLPLMIAQASIMAGAVGCLLYALRDLVLAVDEVRRPPTGG